VVSASDIQIDARRLGQAAHSDGLKARNELLRPGDFLTVRIRRSDPSSQSSSHIAEYRVPYRKRMRVLDVLNHIGEHDAPDLAYRWFCGSKMCGTCAVRMNGREVLASWEAALPDMTLEPLRNLPVVRDLVVDRTPFEQRVAAFQPWIERTEPYAGFP
jgi:succinate dehydrogenase/fumarate reductase iron-sulfur protein